MRDKPFTRYVEVYPASKEARTGAFWAKAAVVSVAINSAILNSLFIAKYCYTFWAFCQENSFSILKDLYRKKGFWIFLFLLFLLYEINRIEKKK